ncbi:MAG: hypothetical protein IT336_15645 [Thermomicrobiales bacterium]|nr:hypothetical protein [Thermomicrobiales bacterium]
MEAELVAHLEALVSAPRLQRYRAAASSDLETATNYLWNIQLADLSFPVSPFWK